MPGLIGRKIGMTSVFSADGKNVPCTVIECGPCVVTQVKTVEKDGYAALQLAYGDKKEKNTTKAMMGIFKKAGTTPKAHLAEFKFDEEHNLGDVITVDLFADSEFVDIVGYAHGWPDGWRPRNNAELESVKSNSGAQPPAREGQLCRMQWFNCFN